MCKTKNSFTWYDAPANYDIHFQEPASPIVEGIIDLHHDVFFYLLIILVFVIWVFFRIVYIFSLGTNNDNLLHKIN